MPIFPLLTSKHLISKQNNPNNNKTESQLIQTDNANTNKTTEKETVNLTIEKPKDNINNESHTEINVITDLGTQKKSTEAIINEEEYYSQNKTLKHFLALVKNNENDTFEGPYKIIDHEKKRFILNIGDKNVPVNEKRIRFCSKKQPDEINFGLLDKELRNKIKPRFSPNYFP